jgi:LL-H family phage holin
MSKTWIDLAITLGWLIVAIGAAIYGKNKAKINKTTAAGKAITIVGELATFAVQEAEHLGTDGETKRKYAVEAVTQALGWLGIKGVTPVMINGAVEDAVKGMKLADQALESKEDK